MTLTTHHSYLHEDYICQRVDDFNVLLNIHSSGIKKCISEAEILERALKTETFSLEVIISGDH